MGEGKEQDTLFILKAWLGSDFLSRQDRLDEKVQLKLAGFRPGKDSLQRLSQEVDSLLFMAVRDATRGRMTLLMDSGRYIRIRVEDFSTLADELLYPMLKGLPRDDQTFQTLSEYSMRHGSLSALRALYVDFRPWQTEEELRILRRVITTCHQPFRWRGWLE